MDGASGSGKPTANGEKKPDEQHFDPSRRIIKRKALIKELAAAYHAECVACCKELLQLQRKWEEEQYVEFKMADEAPRTLTVKSSKRRKR
uniref:Uncharacterized protein n=1 Tax=Oryza meridionalis TaxID=40149 RepID=A0A0E0C6R6_9ORYZ